MTPTAVGVTSTNWEIECICNIASWQPREPGKGADNNHKVRIHQGFKVKKKSGARSKKYVFAKFWTLELQIGQKWYRWTHVASRLTLTTARPQNHFAAQTLRSRHSKCQPLTSSAKTPEVCQTPWIKDNQENSKSTRKLNLTLKNSQKSRVCSYTSKSDLLQCQHHKVTKNIYPESRELAEHTRMLKTQKSLTRPKSRFW